MPADVGDAEERKRVCVTFLPRYAPLGASSRVRAYQFMDTFALHGLDCTCQALLDDRYVRDLYDGKRSVAHVTRLYLRRVRILLAQASTDLIWIEKELLPFVPAAVETLLLSGRRYAVDFDDAIFHNYDLSRVWPIRKLMGTKIDALMRGAALVTVGNSYLEQRAFSAGAPWVERIPSVIDLGRYPDPHGSPKSKSTTREIRVAWIGSPATVRYLDLIRAPIERLALQIPLCLHVIGAHAPTWSGIRIVEVPWSSETEAASLRECDIGIMPLENNPWERGKCGFKLIQYMACSMPVVASPVGMNIDIVTPNVEGFLASSDEEWFQSLLSLAQNGDLRDRMGQAGRLKVEQRYSVQVVGPHLAGLLRRAARVRSDQGHSRGV